MLLRLQAWLLPQGEVPTSADDLLP